MQNCRSRRSVMRKTRERMLRKHSKQRYFITLIKVSIDLTRLQQSVLSHLEIDTTSVSQNESKANERQFQSRDSQLSSDASRLRVVEKRIMRVDALKSQSVR